jgi:PKD repeat protein
MRRVFRRFGFSTPAAAIGGAAVLAAAATFALASAPLAHAVISVPIPADVAPAPPPLADLAAAGPQAPPADVIADPVEPAAQCFGWELRSDYGGFWPAGSTWWEYHCLYSYDPGCPAGMCNADRGGYQWVDHFYWDGSRPVFYGEYYADSAFDPYWSASQCTYWWDAPTSAWYQIYCPPEEPPDDPPNYPPTASFDASCAGSTCDFDASASSDSDGAIVDYSWHFGDGTAASGRTIQHTYTEPSIYNVELTVTDDRGGWTRTYRTVTVEGPNAAPTASFGATCTALTCTLDASSSSDTDGSIQAYRWDLGDGTTGSGRIVEHDYPNAGSYTVRLTVTDDDGASAASSKQIAPITLTARAYKVKGVQTVDLSWNAASGTSYEVYRDGARIATVAAGSYTDNLDRKGAGSYRYRVCETGAAICSNQATLSF